MAGMSNAARQAVFAPLGSGRVDSVVERLSGAIAIGLIGAGEQLPRESELASSLGVSTVTLREALSQLRNLGMVTTRRGRGGGSFAGSPQTLGEARARQRLRDLGAYELRDLGDLGLSITGMSAVRAAQRAPADRLSLLEQLVDDLATADTPAGRRQADGRFHVEIAAAAQSARLALLELSVQAEWAELLWFTSCDDDGSAELFHAQVVTDHRAILAAIRDGDAELARAAAESHVEYGVERVLDLHFLLSED